MKLALVIIILLETVIAWMVCRRLRLSRVRFSTLEFFVLAHIPLIALGVATCAWRYSWSSIEEAWILALYVPLAFAGVLIGAALARWVLPSVQLDSRLEVDRHENGLGRTCLTCFIITLVGLWALSMDPRSFAELARITRTERWISSLDHVPFKQLNTVLIIPVIVLFASLFVSGAKSRIPRGIVFGFASAAFAFSCYIALSRGRIIQAVFAMIVIAWCAGGRKTRRAVLIASLIGIVLFGPLSVALWEYRETLDSGAAIDSVVTMDWVSRIWEDPTFECTDICMAVLHEYRYPDSRRYLDGVKPVLFFFFPRRIWSDKPIVFGPLVWRDVLGGQGEVIGVGPTFIGEAYATAGETGIFLGAVILGALLVLYEVLCYRYLLPWESLGMVAVALVPAATIVRGDFHSAFVMRFVLYPMTYFSVSLMVRAVLKGLKGARPSRRKPARSLHNRCWR